MPWSEYYCSAWTCLEVDLVAMAALIGLRQRVQEVDVEYFLLQRQVELRPLSTILQCSATAGD